MCGGVRRGARRRRPVERRPSCTPHRATRTWWIGPPARPPHAGWWDGLDRSRARRSTPAWWVVAPNILGGCQGTTGSVVARAPTGGRAGSRFPRITVADQVAVEAAARRPARHRPLGRPWSAGRWAGCARSSGRRRPRVGSARARGGRGGVGDQIGTQTTQNHAITSGPGWRGGDYHRRCAGRRSPPGSRSRAASRT